MKLYHFCPKWMMEGILREGLTLGKIVLRGLPDPLFAEGYQWLTKNPDFNQSWCEYSTLPYRRNEVRLTVKIPFTRARQAIRWLLFCKVNPEHKEMWDTLNCYGDPENWFVYHGRIPPEWIKKVKMNSQNL